MQNKLVVLFTSNSETQPAWMLLDSDFAIEQQGFANASHSLAHLAINREVIVVVPAEDVLLTDVKLPNLNRNRLMQALPFALEEQLVDDVDTLHFALGEGAAHNGEYQVAVVANEKIQNWLEQLTQLGLKPDVMVPLTLLVPFQDSTEWHVLIYHLAIARVGQFNGFACDTDNLSKLLTISLTSANPLPDTIYLHNFTSPPLAAGLELEMQVTENIDAPDNILKFIAANIVNLPALNLLQGGFRNKRQKFFHFKKLSNSFLYIGIAVLTLLITYPLVSYLILKPRLSTIQSEIVAIYKTHFPNSKNIIAPKMRLEEKLQLLKGNASQNKLLLLLSDLGKAKTVTAGIDIKRMDFINNQLTIELIATNSESFAKFTEYLESLKLNVKQQNANLNGEKVNASVVID